MAKIVFENGVTYEGTSKELVDILTGIGPADEPKRKSLKVGDYARVIGGTSSLIKGDIVTIKDRGDIYDFIVERVTDGKVGALDTYQLVRVTEESLTEEQWAVIGRKVNELRVGDIVRFVNSIVEIESIDDVCVNFKLGYRSSGATPDKLKLVTPVEFRFDR